MDLEWDSTKSESCYRERGFDFLYAAGVFLDPDCVDVVDDRYDYGEERRIVYGKIEGRLYVVVYTLRGTVHRIISARRANRRDERRITRADR
ncbi:MAG: BrnT family toxin [Proteobacteria bacterium]|nr:BrnT family toxin [Pseudomonadota bacterium]MBI3495717.1 BrnT family toxin [Pseudomonadota bacterium]